MLLTILEKPNNLRPRSINIRKLETYGNAPFQCLVVKTGTREWIYSRQSSLKASLYKLSKCYRQDYLQQEKHVFELQSQHDASFALRKDSLR